MRMYDQLLKTRAELEQYKKALEEEPCPWPADVWTMTAREYVAAVPDEHLRTAISGFLMRQGWELCYRRIRERIRMSDGRR